MDATTTKTKKHTQLGAFVCDKTLRPRTGAGVGAWHAPLSAGVGSHTKTQRENTHNEKTQLREIKKRFACPF